MRDLVETMFSNTIEDISRELTDIVLDRISNYLECDTSQISHYFEELEYVIGQLFKERLYVSAYDFARERANF